MENTKKVLIDGEYTEVVDLTSVLMKYANDKHEEFMNAYNSGQREFKMSFDRGVVYTVKVLGESKESDEFDPKYDVIVVGINIEPSVYNWDAWEKFNAPEYYPIGYRRWVRTYDLMKVI